MSVEVDALLQEAKESIEAAQNYRSELQQRLHGLNQARKQVPPSVHTSYTHFTQFFLLGRHLCPFDTLTHSLCFEHTRPGRAWPSWVPGEFIYSLRRSLLSLPSSCCLDLPFQLLTVNNAAISCCAGRTESLRGEKFRLPVQMFNLFHFTKTRCCLTLTLTHFGQRQEVSRFDSLSYYYYSLVPTCELIKRYSCGDVGRSVGLLAQHTVDDRRDARWYANCRMFWTCVSGSLWATWNPWITSFRPFSHLVSRLIGREN